MKTQVFGACNRYVQGYGELNRLADHIGWMGDRPLVIASKNRMAEHRQRLESVLAGMTPEFFEFSGECDWATVNALVELGRDRHTDIVVGLGAGKIADTSKLVAHRLGAATVIIPTAAASDASTSATSLVYRADGTIEDVIAFPRSPELVLADTEILLKSPARLFVSGMGDALSTYIGARACRDGYFANHLGGVFTETGFAIAKLSYEQLMTYGMQAKLAAEQGALTDAYNAIVEVNLLMSGLGFENNGSSSDHLFYFGTFALTDRAEKVYHGEGVAFSTCCQLVMQGAPAVQLDEVFGFCRKVGLPITFAEMGLDDITEDELDRMADAVLKEPFIVHHAFPVTHAMVVGAYRAADRLGRFYHSGGRLID